LKTIPLRETILNIPNVLTLSRLIVSPFVGYFILNEQYEIALGAFVYAGVTDLLDGIIARNYNQKTMVGTVIDPLADKTLMTVLTVTLAMKDLLPSRDLGLILSAFYYRYISLPLPKTLPRYFDMSIPSAEIRPTLISKVNTTLQLVLMGTTLASPVFGWINVPFLKTLHLILNDINGEGLFGSVRCPFVIKLWNLKTKGQMAKRVRQAQVTLLEVGVLDETLHYGPYSRYWWKTNKVFDNKDITYFPIRIGQKTKVILNNREFIITIVIGYPNNPNLPGYTCQSDAVYTELPVHDPSTAISSIYTSIFDAKTHYSEKIEIKDDVCKVEVYQDSQLKKMVEEESLNDVWKFFSISKYNGIQLFGLDYNVT
ncbi:8382_t:CDS:2, partial [Scutellospora calospora]